MRAKLPSPVELLFPSKCIICQALVKQDTPICAQCARKLKPTGAKACQKGDFFDGCYSPFFYREPLRDSFHRYKFNGFQHYSRLYGKWMADCLCAHEETSFDCVTWAPLSRLRRWRRGYDQAELLAREIGRRLGLPVASTLQKRYRRPLSKLSGDKAIRAARVLGAYTLCPRASVKGKRLLLVDDIVTSGATLSECARVLKTHGAAEVVCVTLARK